MLLLLIPATYGAKVSGFIYDKELNIVQDVVIEINSTPNQRQISRNGGYSFDVEPGNYSIIASLSQNYVTKTIAQEEITVTGNGEFIVDLVIFPDIDLEQDFKPYRVYLLFFGLAILIFVAIFTGYKWYKRRKNSNKENKIEYKIHYDHEGDQKTQENIEPIKVQYESDDDKLKRKILTLISENDNQISQKELRKKIPLSEAKISQVITELTNEGKIQKIKQGRINIIIIKK